MAKKSSAKKPGMKKARRGRGEGGVYQRGDGQWVGSVSLGRDPVSGKRRRKTFYAPTKAELLAKLTAARSETSAAVPAAGQARQTLADWLASWLKVKGRDWAPSTLREHQRHADLHIIPSIGGVRLDKIDRETVERFVSALVDDGVRRPMVGKVLTNTLRAALVHAVEVGVLATNPAEFVRPPKYERVEPVALDAAQLRLFLDAARADPLYAMWLFSADSGCRQGEAFGLVWANVRLADNTVSIVQSLEELDGTHRIKVPKTTSSRRDIRLTDTTVAALEELRTAQTATGRHDADRPVFQNQRGGLLRKSNTREQSFLPIVARANTTEVERAAKEGRSPRTIPPTFTAHGLRHTCASLLLANGVDIVTVSRRLGHSRVGITLDIYAHLMHDTQDKAAATLQRLFEQPPDIGYKSATESPKRSRKRKTQVEE